MKIGIMGGTFNPVHTGHMDMIQAAVKAAGLEYVLMIPTGNPPHKDASQVIPKYDRYEFCLLAAADFDNVVVSSIEIERDGVTYTIDTLRELERESGIRDGIHFIIGGDTVMQLESWKDFRDVLRRCSFIAFGRAGMDETAILDEISRLESQYGARIVFIKSGIPDIASSDLRDMIRKDESVEGLIPPRVAEYIRRHNLYKNSD